MQTINRLTTVLAILLATSVNAQALRLKCVGVGHTWLHEGRILNAEVELLIDRRAKSITLTGFPVTKATASLIVRPENYSFEGPVRARWSERYFSYQSGNLDRTNGKLVVYLGDDAGHPLQSTFDGECALPKKARF